jgi:hypothetical protein
MIHVAIPTRENGRSTPPPAPEQSLADRITDEIAALESDAALMLMQQGEVAAKFLRCARALALEGKDELAERKRKAAYGVLNGVDDE